MHTWASTSRVRLAPRCRLIVTWRSKGFQGSGCSPVKTVHELGLERRETVWSLSTVLLKNARMFKSVREDQTESTTGELAAWKWHAVQLS